MSAPTDTAAAPRSSLVLEPRPPSRKAWLAELWSYRGTLGMLARTDFHARYKRASLGVLWAVAVPALQATVLAVIFSRFIRFEGDFSYAAYAIAGVVAWSYFSQTLGASSIAIVERSDLADKVWFPRALLVLSPCLANLPGLLITVTMSVLILPLLGVSLELRTLLVAPAVLLLAGFTIALALVVSALHVYFRDVRYLVQAALLVLFYATPIVYPQLLVDDLAPWLNLNPMTGVVNLFHLAVVGNPDAWTADLVPSLAITGGVTATLALVALEVHRRRDRLFVDLL